MTETGTFKELLNDSGLDPKSFIKRRISKRLDHFVSDWKEDTIKLRDSSKQETLLFLDIQEFPGAPGWRDTGGQGGGRQSQFIVLLRNSFIKYHT